MRNKKRAECIVETYEHLWIFKNTREVRRSTSRRVLENSQVLIYLNNARGTRLFISFIKCIVSCARSYRWRRLLALYLNSALVLRKARALWKHNELVLTNHGARISLNILWNEISVALFLDFFLTNKFPLYFFLGQCENKLDNVIKRA